MLRGVVPCLLALSMSAPCSTRYCTNGKCPLDAAFQSAVCSHCCRPHSYLPLVQGVIAHAPNRLDQQLFANSYSKADNQLKVWNVVWKPDVFEMVFKGNTSPYRCSQSGCWDPRRISHVPFLIPEETYTPFPPLSDSPFWLIVVQNLQSTTGMTILSRPSFVVFLFAAMATIMSALRSAQNSVRRSSIHSSTKLRAMDYIKLGDSDLQVSKVCSKTLSKVLSYMDSHMLP